MVCEEPALCRRQGSLTIGESGRGGDRDDEEEGGEEEDPCEVGYADAVSVATEAHVSDG